MNLKTNAEQGWTEAIIYDNCGSDKFFVVANILKSDFDLTFTNKLNNLDSMYWDFEYNGCKLVLHHNVLASDLVIFPEAFKRASSTDNNAVIEIATLLLNNLTDLSD